jgi:hypothetical protein
VRLRGNLTSKFSYNKSTSEPSASTEQQKACVEAKKKEKYAELGLSTGTATTTTNAEDDLVLPSNPQYPEPLATPNHPSSQEEHV